MVVVISLAIAQDMPAAHEIRHGGSSWQKVFTSSRIGPLAQAASTGGSVFELRFPRADPPGHRSSAPAQIAIRSNGAVQYAVNPPQPPPAFLPASAVSMQSPRVPRALARFMIDPYTDKLRGKSRGDNP
jgi:hypothetical protein